MNYTITKLDKRHSWHSSFDFMICFNKPPVQSSRETGVLDFDRSRRWFTKTYGWSQDVDSRAKISFLYATLSKSGMIDNQELNPYWSYSLDYRDYRIYVRSEKEVEWFVLSHPHKEFQ